jgi:pimeloyl-ACP methyl ester carboxylesterase
MCTFIIAAMDRADRAALLVVAVACLGLLAACGGSGPGHSSVTPRASDWRLPLDAKAVDDGSRGDVRLEQITYTSADGSTVPALLSIPASERTRGCLMYQGGLGQRREEFPSIREGAAALGLATFTIEPRNTGQRGGWRKLQEVMRSPEAIASMLTGSEMDLERGLDYLETRPACHHNIGYLGTSFGARIGVLLAGQDARIHAVALTSLGATYKEAILANNQAARSVPGVAMVLLPDVDRDRARLAQAAQLLSPYDPAKWVPKIAPRPLMLVNGRFDPITPPADALELASAAQEPKTVLYFNGGHNPFAAGPDQRLVDEQIARFFCAYLISCPTRF